MKFRSERYFGQISNGKLIVAYRRRMDQDIKLSEDCDVEITIKGRGKRSNRQNAYYWGCIIPEIKDAFRHRGVRMDGEQMHEFLKLHFNKQYVYGEGGEVLFEYGGSTADLAKDEFAEYLEKIIQWCAEKLDLVIPAASTHYEMQYKNAI